jgi:hypothetical protein
MLQHAAFSRIAATDGSPGRELGVMNVKDNQPRQGRKKFAT